MSKENKLVKRVQSSMDFYDGLPMEDKKEIMTEHNIDNNMAKNVTIWEDGYMSASVDSVKSVLVGFLAFGVAYGVLKTWEVVRTRKTIKNPKES